MYRRCLTVKDYEALLLRRTWDELNKHHFRLMDREAIRFRELGWNVTFSITNREMKFHDTGAVIEGGHMEDPEDVQKYLSRERDEIVCDEGSTFEPKSLLELSTRARSSKPQVHATGSRGIFRVYTNPGGAASDMLYDFFIAHQPNFEEYAPKLKEVYKPEDWVYVPGNLEDNPYLPEEYEADLAVLQPWRYQQLRHNDWTIRAGQFFTTFAESTHVQDLDAGGRFYGDNYEWFRALDWGYSNPGCVLWFACLPDGKLYIRLEHKYSHALVGQVCENILELDKEISANYIRYTAADPALWGPSTSADALEGENMNETFMRFGVPMIKAKNERKNGWQRVREVLGNPLGKDKLFSPSHVIIHPSCRYLIRTITSAVSDPRDPEDVDTNIDDHAIDTLRYGCMSRPSPTEGKKAQNRPGTFNHARKRIEEHRRAMSRR